MRAMDHEPRICDYEDSAYRTDFWEGQGREYEDLAERIALRRMLPPAGGRLIDIGGGFGRLSEFYDGYEQVILLDYSTSLLRQAQARLGRSERMVYVAANFYDMPFVDGVIDVAMMVRVIHHVEDVPALLGEVARVLAGGGTYVLEFASKRHLKAILRYALRRQAWNPFDQEPVEFVEMNFDFHPDWMWERLREAMFHVKRTVALARQYAGFRSRLGRFAEACEPPSSGSGGRWEPRRESATPEPMSEDECDPASAALPWTDLSTPSTGDPRAAGTQPASEDAPHEPALWRCTRRT